MLAQNSDLSCGSPVPTESVRVIDLRGLVHDKALAIILDIEIIEKVMFRPLVMDLKLDVSYVLVLFGSQVKNSAQENSSK